MSAYYKYIMKNNNKKKYSYSDKFYGQHNEI